VCCRAVTFWRCGGVGVARERRLRAMGRSCPSHGGVSRQAHAVLHVVGRSSVRAVPRPHHALAALRSRRVWRVTIGASARVATLLVAATLAVSLCSRCSPVAISCSTTGRPRQPRGSAAGTMRLDQALALVVCGWTGARRSPPSRHRAVADSRQSRAHGATHRDRRACSRPFARPVRAGLRFHDGGRELSSRLVGIDARCGARRTARLAVATGDGGRPWTSDVRGACAGRRGFRGQSRSCAAGAHRGRSDGHRTMALPPGAIGRRGGSGPTAPRLASCARVSSGPRVRRDDATRGLTPVVFEFEVPHESRRRRSGLSPRSRRQGLPRLDLTPLEIVAQGRRSDSNPSPSDSLRGASARTATSIGGHSTKGRFWSEGAGRPAAGVPAELEGHAAGTGRRRRWPRFVTLRHPARVDARAGVTGDLECRSSGHACRPASVSFPGRSSFGVDRVARPPPAVAGASAWSDLERFSRVDLASVARGPSRGARHDGRHRSSASAARWPSVRGPSS